jgi:hypothetical protein
MTAHIIHVDFCAIERHRSRPASIDRRRRDARELSAGADKLEAMPLQTRSQAMRNQRATRAPDDHAEHPS